jgi:Uma2 family endonuclease
MSSTATIITPGDLLQMPDQGKGYELMNGELNELDVSKESSHIAGQIFFHLESYRRAGHPSWVFPEGTSYRCFKDDPSRVCRPDTSIIKLERMTNEQYYEEGHCTIVPDLVAEVVSPNDIAQEVWNKIEDWLAAGVKILWEVSPDGKQIRAHRPGDTVKVFRITDTLTAPDLLPGFACPVADLFRLPSEPSTSA